MPWPVRILLLTLLLKGAALAKGTGAQKGAEAPPAAPSVPNLSEEEMAQATRTDAITIPTPGELLVAIDKLGKPDWASEIRPPIATNFASRPQMALNMGGLIADGYIAVEAEDAQQVKNIGKDIMSVARPLGVQQDILNRGKSLTDLADRGQWDTLKEEFAATQNEVKGALVDNKDQDLIALVTLGGWIRGLNAMADYIDKHYSEDAARMLRQPAVVAYLNQRLDALPERVRDDATVRRARTGLGAIEKTISLARGTAPAAEQVKQVSVLTTELLTDLTKRKP